MGIATGTFQYPNGSPVSNGLYQWKLSGDAIEFGTACVAPVLFSGQLDSNGNMTSTFAFNDVLSTACGPSTTYQFTLKAPGGGQVWNETYFLTGTAANLNILLPSCGPGSGGGTVTTLPARTGLIGYVIDGGGTTVSTGVKGQVNIPVPMTVTGWVLTSDQTGSAVLAILAGSYTNFPASMTSIAGSEIPTLSGAMKGENLIVSTWAGALTAGTQVQFSVTSATTVQRLNVGLIVSIPYA